MFGRRPNLREASQLTLGVALFLLALQSGGNGVSGPATAVELWELVPGFNLAFRLEPLGMLFALVASGLWVVTTAYATGYMRAHHEQHQTRFYACFGVAIFAAMGAALSANLLTLFVFYEIMTLSTYPLVTHHGTEAGAARRANLPVDPASSPRSPSCCWRSGGRGWWPARWTFVKGAF